MLGHLYNVFCVSLIYTPLVQKKLDVLSKAGLSKDNFADADTKQVKVSVKQKNKTCRKTYIIHKSNQGFPHSHGISIPIALNAYLLYVYRK